MEKNEFLVLGQGPTQGIHDNTSGANAKFCLSLNYNGDESSLYVKKSEMHKFKVKDNISWYNFCLGRVSKALEKMNRVKFLEMILYIIFQLTIVQVKNKTFLIFTNT